MYKNGVRKFKAANSVWTDTNPGIVKHLKIKWEFDGHTNNKDVKEHTGDVIELPEGSLASEQKNNFIEVHVHPTDTITTIKNKVSTKTGIDVEKFKLKFEGKDLSDESLTVADTKIKAESVLNIVLKKITLVVTTNDNKQIAISILTTEKISHLKSIISSKGGIGLDRFFLRLGDGTDLQESMTLDEAHITESSTILIIYYKV